MFPMLNWFIPKTYEKLTKNDVNNLDFVIPNRDNSKTLFASGLGVFISLLFRPISAVFDIHLERMTSIIICVLILLSIIFLHMYLYKTLTLRKYNFSQNNPYTLI